MEEAQHRLVATYHIIPTALKRKVVKSVVLVRLFPLRFSNQLAFDLDLFACILVMTTARRGRTDRRTRHIALPSPLTVSHSAVFAAATKNLYVLFCSLAVLDPRVDHAMDVLSQFISVFCHSD